MRIHPAGTVGCKTALPRRRHVSARSGTSPPDATLRFSSSSTHPGAIQSSPHTSPDTRPAPSTAAPAQYPPHRSDAEITAASVDGEYPATSSHRSCCVTGAYLTRNAAARSTNGKISKLSQPIQLPQPPRQNDRKRHFVQLNPRPVRRTVDPEVLRKAPIRPLRTRQIHQRPHRRIRPPARQQRRRRLHHIARPHQVIPAQVRSLPSNSPTESTPKQ